MVQAPDKDDTDMRAVCDYESGQGKSEDRDPLKREGQSSCFSCLTAESKAEPVHPTVHEKIRLESHLCEDENRGFSVEESTVPRLLVPATVDRSIRGRDGRLSPPIQASHPRSMRLTQVFAATMADSPNEAMDGDGERQNGAMTTTTTTTTEPPHHPRSRRYHHLFGVSIRSM